MSGLKQRLGAWCVLIATAAGLQAELVIRNADFSQIGTQTLPSATPGVHLYGGFSVGSFPLVPVVNNPYWTTPLGPALGGTATASAWAIVEEGTAGYQTITGRSAVLGRFDVTVPGFGALQIRTTSIEQTVSGSLADEGEYYLQFDLETAAVGFTTGGQVQVSFSGTTLAGDTYIDYQTGPTRVSTAGFRLPAGAQSHVLRFALPANSGAIAIDNVRLLAGTPPPPPPLPPAPDNVTAQKAGDTSIEVCWRNNAGTVDRFELYQSVDNGPYNLKQTVPGDTTCTTVSNLTLGRTYCYKVKAVKNALPSNLSSDSDCVTLEVPPPPPPPPGSGSMAVVNGTFSNVGSDSLADGDPNVHLYGGFLVGTFPLVPLVDNPAWKTPLALFGGTSLASAWAIVEEGSTRYHTIDGRTAVLGTFSVPIPGFGLLPIRTTSIQQTIGATLTAAAEFYVEFDFDTATPGLDRGAQVRVSVGGTDVDVTATDTFDGVSHAVTPRFTVPAGGGSYVLKFGVPSGSPNVALDNVRVVQVPTSPPALKVENGTFNTIGSEQLASSPGVHLYGGFTVGSFALVPPVNNPVWTTPLGLFSGNAFASAWAIVESGAPGYRTISGRTAVLGTFVIPVPGFGGLPVRTTSIQLSIGGGLAEPADYYFEFDLQTADPNSDAGGQVRVSVGGTSLSVLLKDTAAGVSHAITPRFTVPAGTGPLVLRFALPSGAPNVAIDNIRLVPAFETATAAGTAEFELDPAPEEPLLEIDVVAPDRIVAPSLETITTPEAQR